MKKIISVSVLLFASFLSINAQSHWIRSYGGTLADSPNSIEQTKDGGFIIAGQSFSFGGGFWLLKLYPNGEVEWEKSYNGNAGAWGAIAKQTDDDGYIVAGATNSFSDNGTVDIWILKLFPDGEIDWQKTYGGSGEEVAYSIEQTIDGGYIVGGYTSSFGSNNYDIWVIKLSPYGDIRWEKRYGSGFLGSVKQTSEGGYVILGQSPALGSSNIWVLKLFPDGNPEWSHTYGVAGGVYNRTADIVQTTDGGYAIVTSASFGGSNDFWISKLFPDGEIEWQYAYSWLNVWSVETNDCPFSIHQTSDEGFIIAGESSGPSGWGSNADARILKLYPNGQEDWERIFNLSTGDSARSIIRANDGDYVVSATSVIGDQSEDVIVLKISSSGDIDPSCAWLSNSNSIVTPTTASATDFSVQALDTSAQITITNIAPQNTNCVSTLICQAMVPDPVIFSLFPDSGPVGTEVTISGTNFGSEQGTITFNGVNAGINSWINTQIVTVVPSGATTGAVVVHTSDNKESNGYLFTVIPGQEPPFISSISPNEGPPGLSVTITGLHFGPTIGRVEFAETAAEISFWTEDKIVVAVPSGISEGPCSVAAYTSLGSKSNEVVFRIIDCRAELIRSLEDLKYWLVRAIQVGTEDIAEVYAKAAQINVDTPWWREISRWLSKAINTAFATANYIIKMANLIISPYSFFTPDGSGAVIADNAAAKLYLENLIAAGVGGGFLILKNWQGLVQTTKDLQLISASVDDVAKQTSRQYKKFGYDRAYQYAFSRFYLSGDKSPMTIPERSGKWLPSNRPKDLKWAKGTAEVELDIQNKFNSQIANIPETIPLEFPLGQVRSYLNAIKEKIKDSLKGDNAGIEVRFTQYFNDGASDLRKATLGRMSQGRLVANALFDAWIANMDVQVAAEWRKVGENVLFSFIYYFGPSNQLLRIISGLYDLYKIYEIAYEDGQSTLSPKSALEALNELCLQLVNSLSEETMNIWAISDGALSYVDFMLGEITN